MAHLLVTSKTLQKNGQQMNNAAGSKPSAYAVKLMEKMGWKDGQGLGKNEDGIAKHIVITKREENLGLGLDNSKAADSVQEQWWHNSFSATLANFSSNIQPTDDSDDSKRGKKSKKDKKDKKNKKNDKKDKKKATQDDNNSNSESEKKTKSMKRKRDQVTSIERGHGELGSINYDELFKATGGARLGMRARREQKGKIIRTEGAEALIVNKK